MMDFYRNGTGLAFGKAAEAEGAVEFGWPLILAAPLALSMGGTGADSPMAALVSLGATAANHSHLPNELTGPLSIAKGGTGAASAKAALSNLGIFYADTLPASGVDGQICLVPV